MSNFDIKDYTGKLRTLFFRGFHAVLSMHTVCKRVSKNFFFEPSSNMSLFLKRYTKMKRMITHIWRVCSKNERWSQITYKYNMLYCYIAWHQSFHVQRISVHVITSFCSFHSSSSSQHSNCAVFVCLWKLYNYFPPKFCHNLLASICSVCNIVWIILC